jgi:hypothetical protein
MICSQNGGEIARWILCARKNFRGCGGRATGEGWAAGARIGSSPRRRLAPPLRGAGGRGGRRRSRSGARGLSRPRARRSGKGEDDHGRVPRRLAGSGVPAVDGRPGAAVAHLAVRDRSRPRLCENAIFTAGRAMLLRVLQPVRLNESGEPPPTQYHCSLSLRFDVFTQPRWQAAVSLQPGNDSTRHKGGTWSHCFSPSGTGDAWWRSRPRRCGTGCAGDSDSRQSPHTIIYCIGLSTEEAESGHRPWPRRPFQCRGDEDALDSERIERHAALDLGHAISRE